MWSSFYLKDLRTYKSTVNKTNIEGHFTLTISIWCKAVFLKVGGTTPL